MLQKLFYKNKWDFKWFFKEFYKQDYRFYSTDFKGLRANARKRTSLGAKAEMLWKDSSKKKDLILNKDMIIKGEEFKSKDYWGEDQLGKKKIWTKDKNFNTIYMSHKDFNDKEIFIRTLSEHLNLDIHYSILVRLECLEILEDSKGNFVKEMVHYKMLCRQKGFYVSSSSKELYNDKLKRLYDFYQYMLEILL